MKLDMHIYLDARTCAFYRFAQSPLRLPWQPRKTAFLGDSANFGRHFLDNEDLNQNSDSYKSCVISCRLGRAQFQRSTLKNKKALAFLLKNTENRKSARTAIFRATAP